jgi:5'-nucleotidase
MQTRTLRVLVTNDDGIHALGIKHLCNALKGYAEFVVVAPASEQSAVSLSTTIRHPLRIEKIHWEDHSNIWSVTGTPADCVKLALSVLLDYRPDLVIAGINRGTNAGRNVLYSGTVAATIESVIQGIPAIAFSCRDYIDPNYRCIEKYIPLVMQYVLEHPLPKGTLLNVNFPEKKFEGIKGFKLARQGNEYWGENPDMRHHPAEGHSYYWLGAKLKQSEEDEESDITWLKRGYMTAVPVHIGDLTDHQYLQAKRALFENLFARSNA